MFVYTFSVASNRPDVTMDEKRKKKISRFVFNINFIDS